MDRPPPPAASMLAEIDRRRFLRVSAVGAVVLGAAAWLPLGCSRDAAAPRDLARLGAVEAATLDALAETLAPGVAAPDTARWADAWLEGVDPVVLSRLRGGLRLLDLAPAWTGVAAARFSRLDPAMRERVLDRLSRSRFETPRVLLRGLSELAFLAIYSRESTWSAIGYDGPLVRRGEAGG